MQTQILPPPLKKPNDAIVMFPKIGKLTAYGRKFYISLMREAQQHLFKKVNAGEDFLATDFFKEPLSNIIRPISKPMSNVIEVTKQYVKEMQTTQVEWSAPDATSGVIWDSMVLVSQAKIEIENGKLYLLWAFPPDMVNALKDPERKFTLIAPEDLINLKSYTAVALYEICARYADNPSHKTSRKPKEWWVAALSGDSHKTSARSKATAKPREWRKFKNEFVNRAILEINKETGIVIELVEYKTGNAVVDVQFSVARKNRVLAAPTAAHIEAAKLGVPAQHITNSLNSGETQDQVLFVLAVLKSRIEDKTVEPIPKEKRGAYFEGIRKKQVGRTEEPTAQPQKQDKISDVEARQEVSAVALINEHVLKLPEALNAPILEHAKNRFVERNLFTAVIQKRFSEGNWRVGSIFHEVVALYATEIFGETWRAMHSDDVEKQLALRARVPAVGD